MFLPFLQHLTYDFKIGSAMRFFKNASKTQYNGRKKSHLERARPKKYESIHPSQKVAEESQKNKFINFQTHLKLNTLVICVLTANTLMRHSVSLNVRS